MSDLIYFVLGAILIFIGIKVAAAYVKASNGDYIEDPILGFIRQIGAFFTVHSATKNIKTSLRTQ